MFSIPCSPISPQICPFLNKQYDRPGRLYIFELVSIKHLACYSLENLRYTAVNIVT